MDLASNILQINMKFLNIEPPCCMSRPKMMRNSWTLKERLQYILARGLLRKGLKISKYLLMKAHESKMKALL